MRQVRQVSHQATKASLTAGLLCVRKPRITHQVTRKYLAGWDRSLATLTVLGCDAHHKNNPRQEPDSLAIARERG
jgi:hypothetical protein